MRRFVKFKALLLILLLTAATLSVLPSFAQVGKFELPSWISDTFTREFKLGLDLQGGLHLEYSVAVEEALDNKLEQMGGELESAFKDKKDITVTTEREGQKTLLIKFQNPEDINLATEDVMAVVAGYLVRDEEGTDLDAGIIRMKVPDEVIEESQKAVIGQAIETVRRRVDSFGVAEPNIYPKNRHVVIELPGVSDTATELKAAIDEAANQLMTLLTAEGVQAQASPLREDPGAMQMRVPDQDARAELTKLFGEDKLIEVLDDETQEVLGMMIFDDRLGAEVMILPEDPGAEPDPEMIVIALTDKARDEVLEAPTTSAVCSRRSSAPPCSRCT